jgi:hypothetical protein
VADPEFAVLAVAVTAVSKIEEEPPGAIVPDAAPEVGNPAMEILV